jgi:GntR family transcriptional regulator
MAVAADPGSGPRGEALVVLDPAAGSPAAQVHDQLLAHVAAGRLAAGARLPTVRALAGHLGLSTATVAKAYRRLEEAGVTRTATRAGTVVEEGGAAVAAASTVAAGGTAAAGGTGAGPAAGGGRGAAAEAGPLARAAVAAGLDDAAAHRLLTEALAVARRP